MKKWTHQINESKAAWHSTGYTVNTMMNVCLHDLDLILDGLTESLGKRAKERESCFVCQLSETTVRTIRYCQNSYHILFPPTPTYVQVCGLSPTCMFASLQIAMQTAIRLHKHAQLCVFAPLLICIILLGLKTTQTLLVNKLCYQQPQLILSEISLNALRMRPQ